MKRIRLSIVSLLACTGIAIALGPESVLAETCEKWAGKAVSVQGIVQAKRAGQSQWQAVTLNETFCPGDTIRTEKKSRAEIALYNHPVLRLDQNTTVTLGGTRDTGASLVDLIQGAAMFFSRVSRNLEVRTATVNAGVEGTEFFIRVEEGKTDLTVFEGKVLASNAAGRLAVATGQSAVAEAGKAPAYRTVVRPRDAVQWALYYPPIVHAPPADRKEEGNDPRFYTHRASQLLAVGRVDEANADIDKAQKLDSGNSDAFALQSIIAVTQNEKGKALDLARKAVESDPKSATARIALSYAQQSHFDLPGALRSLEEAVKVEPENALAWARLAELQQSFGELDKSLKAAEKAVSLNPDLSRTQTVLGFAHLTQVNTKAAGKAFGKAIDLDQADPLPRLGLGLAMIRDGKLEEGRRELEIGIALDPDNGLMRSYLGKAYFEEKRDNLAKGQYDMAKTLDPKDPTPYFYDAIRKQTINQPVEALQDLQKAIDLNDNRAVYRSRLLLDQDLAARSASLARIYGDLGFQQLALVEGWKSVNTDPGNYSAHRFLADSYSALPRHEIARVSELLQSQLLQPLNITPVQPHLSESNLFLLEGAGPSSLSFNEFNPLFLRNRFALQASGILGENGTAGEEITVSGLHNKTSFSVGQFHHQTNGFRPNNDRNDNIYNTFFQASLTPRTSLQAEFRYRDLKYGDLSLNFFPDDFLNNLRNHDETGSIRAGFHHAFSPGSDLIGNFMYQDQDRDLGFILEVPEFFLLSKVGLGTKVEAKSGELQYLFNSRWINVTAGAGHFDVDTDDLLSFDDFDVSTVPPTPLGGTSIPSESDIRHTNVYLYSYTKCLKNLTFTVGGSADFFDGKNILGGGDIKEDRFNPKFGITWNPFVSTTVRAAAFRTLKRTLITNQTLEPTQVAGFNQFFDDPDGTKAWRYGAAVDQKFSNAFYGGVEFSKRDLDVPVFVFPDPLDPTVIQLQVVDWREKLARAYLYWTPREWLAVRGEYQYEKLDRGPEFVAGAREVETHRVPLGASFFLPLGLSANVQATYYDQEGDFERQDTPPGTFLSGADRFWLIDATIGYRLPKRYGVVTIGVKNLFDESFSYFDPDFVNPSIQPERMFITRFTLSI